MTQAKMQMPVAETELLLIVPEPLDDGQLWRAASIADAFDATLQVYCPIVLPPVPHTEMTPSAPAAGTDQGVAREEGRRLAARTLAAFNERNVAAQVETGICASIVDGIVNAASRLEPDILILPKRPEAGLLEQAFTVRFEELWSKLDAATWILHPDRRDASNVVGLLDLEARGRGGMDANDRVAMEASRIASRRGSDAHLAACARQPLAIATARDAMAPDELLSIPEKKEGRMVRKLYEIADRFDLPEAHIHLYHGSEDDVLEQMLEPLGIGLVVTSGRPRRLLGGLLKRHRAARLLDLPCDLFVLGEADVPHA